MAESFIFNNPELSPIKGITTPYVYIGTSKTYFAFHIEDVLLVSLNYLHAGEPKIWYIIPPQYRQQVEALVRKFGETQNLECPEYIMHKGIMIPPTVLEKHGIPFRRLI